MISAVIPAFNHPGLLGQTIRTLEAQTQLVDEILVVDDGSDPPLRLPSHIKVLRLERAAKHRGAAFARNAGVEAAAGDVILMLDSSVLLLPETVESFQRTLDLADCKLPDIALAFTVRTLFDEDDRVYTPEETADMSTFMDRMGIPAVKHKPTDSNVIFPDHCCALYGRSTFDRLDGYDEKTFADWGMENHDFDIRLRILGGDIISNIPRVGHSMELLQAFHNYHGATRDKVTRNKAFSSKWGRGNFTHIINVAGTMGNPDEL